MATSSVDFLVKSPLPVSLPKEKAPSSVSLRPTPVASGSTATLGQKNLTRLTGLAAPAQNPSNDDTALDKLASNTVSDMNDLVNAAETSDPDTDKGYQDKMFQLFAKVLADIALIMQYMSKNMGLQSNISDDSLAVAKQTAQIIQKKLDDMKAEQEKASGIANLLKIIGIVIIVLSVLTCNPEEAPLSTAITVAMTAIVASGGFDQDGYITKGLIQPLSDSLQKSGMSKHLADFFAKLIVILVMVAAGSTAGAGADSQLAGKAAADSAADGAGAGAAGADAAGADVAAEAAESGQFLERLAGNSKQLLAQGITSSNMINDLLSTFIKDKTTLAVLSAIINAAFSFGLNYSAGKNLASINTKATGQAASLIKAGASAGMIVGQTVQSTFLIQEAKVLQSQADTTEELGTATAIFALVNSWVQMNSSQLKTTNSSLQQAGDQLQAEAKAIDSITTPGQAAIRALSETRF